jgi:glycine/D-amino acid oxidase-like deaminating enzyme/nitrite reductase/ring-hydroxylating ferredoxin subunit
MDASPSSLSLWAREELPLFPRVNRDLDVDVLVLGGGLTGLTAAYLLVRAGARVAVLERRRLGAGDTSHTTAHVTAITDARPDELRRLIGDADAAALWAAGLGAMLQIERLVETLDIACDWRRVPGFLHAPFDAPEEECARQRPSFRQDAEWAQQWGVPATAVGRVPVVESPGVQFPSQAVFHPVKYLRGLATGLRAEGVPVYEHSEAVFTDDPEHLDCHGHHIRAGWILMATHNPLPGREARAKAHLRQTKLALYTSHVLSARLTRAAPADGLFWDTNDPYRYLRLETDDQGCRIVAGGEDHKTGQASDSSEPQGALERWVRQLFPDAAVTHRWSGQVIETPDATPFIGEVAPRQWIATGYAGNGMTFGTLAAMLMRDAVTGVDNPWARVVSPARASATRDPWTYLTENTDYPYYMLRRLLGRDAGGKLYDLARGHGAVVTRDGHHVAAARDDEGRFHLRSATCTHMGCQVTWNELERSWDCPCHGSRFGIDGQVLSGPAEHGLAEPPTSGGR